jgi:hypothetical protein
VPADRRFLLFIGICAAVTGTAVAWWYFTQDLTLSHYDAKAHLVVARRVFDSLTPGWKQFGGVWLPLPHLLNVLPVQVDALYRTGLSGVAISVACFTIACVAVAAIVHGETRSPLAASAAVVVFAGDPNVLYLQSTPMTEPLLFALLALSVFTVHRWLGEADGITRAWVPGLTLALACLTRYEAWPVTVVLLGLAAVVRVRTGRPVAQALREVTRVASWPVVAILLFVVNSRVSTGSWFVTGGFFIPENDAHERPLTALAQVGWGLHQVVGRVTIGAGLAGMLVAIWWFVRSPRRAHAVSSLALLATAALPFYAFVEGHPFRIRYMVVLALGVAVCSGFAVAALGRWPLRLAALGVLAVAGPSPLDARAPMVTEAQWDRPNTRARSAGTACLSREFVRPRDKILASMGSLAHYMQELSLAGFRLDDFVHEGTDDIWPDTVDSPRRHVQWILFEEVAEGGDALTQRRRRFPDLVDGFVRVCDGGGVALYRKPPPADHLLP